MLSPEFLSKPMDQMSAEEWESLCDGCGLCCQVSEEDEETGEVVLTNQACEFLCLNSHRCSDYANRFQNQPLCVKVTPENVFDLYWLPESCGYKRIAHGAALPEWHHLICGDKEAVHERGPSMRGSLVSGS
jgi:uncharacterized cysteine cluster protein YcgN (CxxCxxCC family)